MTTCAKCAESIEPNAERCPHCDYAPAEKYREESNTQFKMAGLCTIFFWLVITIPMIPICLTLGIWYRRKASKATPTA